VYLLNDETCFDANYSEPVIEHGIVVRPGDLVAVALETCPPQVVFRWALASVERVEGEHIFIDTPCSRGRPMARAEGVEIDIAAGDKVFTANGQVHDIAVDGRPANPEHLRVAFFPQIRAMYQQMETWNALDPKQVVQEGYDRIAERHLEWSKTVRSEERAHYTSVLLDELPSGATVLDLGCGTGVPTTQELAQRFKVTGVDISHRHIELARQNVPEAKFIQADITQLDFPPASFDAVAAFYSLIHVPRQEQPKLLHDIASWLRPNGLFVASMGTHSVKREFDEDFLGARMFWSSFDSETNKRLVEEAGLRIMSAQEETAMEFGAPVTFLWLIARKPRSHG
jgi:SAM-dependent methyltransferase